MTVSSTTRKAGPFGGNDVATSFPFTFKVFSDEDLSVTRRSADGVEIELVLDSDYSVTLNPDQDSSPGGTVTYPITGEPLPTGDTLTIITVLQALQDTDIQNLGGFYPQVIEDRLDYLTILLQQFAELFSRTIVAAVSDEVPDLSVGTSVSRANKFLTFNADGDLELATTLPGTVSPSIIGEMLYPQTVVEAAAGVTPTNYTYIPSPRIDPRRYGVVGDGVTDDTAAMQTAINLAYAQGARIILPQDFDVLTTGLSLTMTGNRLNQSLAIEGAGMNSSRFTQSGTPTQLIKVQSTNPSVTPTDAQLVLEGFSIYGSGKTCHGLTLDGVAKFALRDLIVDGFDRNVNCLSSLIGFFENCNLSAGNYGLITRLDGSGPYCNLIKMKDSRIFSNSTFGLDIGSASMFMTDNVDMEVNGTAGNISTGAIIIRDTCDDEIGVANIYLNRLWLEGNLGRGIQVEAMSELTLVLNQSQIIAQESGRAVVIAGARYVSIEDSYSPSVGDTWNIECDQLYAKNSKVTVLNGTQQYSTAINFSANGADHVSGITGSFTATLTGCTTSPTGTVTWTKQGKRVRLNIPDITGTSNTTAATLTGMPASLFPSTARNCAGICRDNGSEKFSPITIQTNGTITLNNAFAAFTSSGTKGVSALTVLYDL